jgi:hypothetical protein
MLPPPKNEKKNSESKPEDSGDAKIGNYNIGTEGDDFGTRIGEGHDKIEDEVV